MSKEKEQPTMILPHKSPKKRKLKLRLLLREWSGLTKKEFRNKIKSLEYSNLTQNQHCDKSKSGTKHNTSGSE